MVYELRIYDIVPTAKAALYNRFENGALDLIGKHGIDLVDMWEPCDGRERLYSLYKFPDANAREDAWDRFRADPAWQKLKAESEASGPLLTKYDSWLVRRPAFLRR